MSNFRSLFEYAKNNNVKALNKSISDMGKQHHAKYITGMMYHHSLNDCYDSLADIWNGMEKLAELVNQNNLYKQKIGNQLSYTYDIALGEQTEVQALSKKMIFDIVLRHAFKYYFSMDLRKIDSMDLFIESAVQYRASANLFKRKIEILKCETEEMIQLVQLDTWNIKFLYSNYIKFNKKCEGYSYYMDLLKKNILNQAFCENGRIEKRYFEMMKQLDSYVKQIT